MEDSVHKEELLTPEIVEAMGISQLAFEEVQCIIGRMPTVEELSTLLAMWEANGRQQSLYGWLKGQHHLVEKQEYLYTGTDTQHKSIREPRVKDCIALAHQVLAGLSTPPPPLGIAAHISRSENLYIELILGSLLNAGIITSARSVGQGGLFASLVESCRPSSPQPPVGFDILTCREIRLDAFLFGEEPGRYVVSLPESQDDLFLLKMGEARLNCCFLGHATKGRLLVDDMDYGSIESYLTMGEPQPLTHL